MQRHRFIYTYCLILTGKENLFLSAKHMLDLKSFYLLLTITCTELDYNLSIYCFIVIVQPVINIVSNYVCD